MEPIKIKGDRKTPSVILDKQGGTFSIIGKSVLEDAKKFYDPLLEWFSWYELNANNSTTLILKLDYFNTASSMMILAILLKLKAIAQNGKRVLVQWHYDEDDIRESGMDYEEATGIPFEHIGEIEDDFPPS